MARWNSGARWNDGTRWNEPDKPAHIKHTHMRDLHIWLTNPFDDPKISMAELLAFTTDHLERMTVAGLTVLAPRIMATTTALDGVSDSFTDDETKLGLRKASKQAKAAYRDALPAAVGKMAVAVEVKFGEKSKEFVECFPHGRTVFSQCTDDEVANHLQTLINGVTNHQVQLSVQTVTDATALLTGWTAVWSPSESSSGAKVATISAKNAARAALQLELFKNLLTLALNFPRQPEQLDLYMQQSLLQPHTQTATASAPAPTAATGTAQ